MAAEVMISRSSKVFTNLLGNRCLSFSRYRNIKRAAYFFSIKSKEPTPHSSCVYRRTFCTAAKAKIQEEPQQLVNIFSAVCLERLPFVTPDTTELQNRYEELQDQLELERSALSEDEVQVKKVMQRKKKLTERDEDENLEVAQFEEQRKEFQEEQEEEYRQFQPAGRQTDADLNQDLKSLHRRLQDTLVLLLKTTDAQWEMPQCAIHDQEPLRKAAERRLEESCGSEMKVKFVSNAPAGVMKTVGNKTRTTNKVFFYKACYTGGMLQLGAEYQDYVWVTREEMRDFLKPEHFKIASKFVQ